jgi:hypothetical protein
MDAMSDTKLAVPPEFDAASKEERIEGNIRSGRSAMRLQSFKNEN